MDTLERQIKERLSGHQIEPSPDAWQRLSSRLNGPGTGKRRAWKAYALAACSLGVILMALGRLAKGEGGAGNPQTVEREGEAVRPWQPSPVPALERGGQDPEREAGQMPATLADREGLAPDKGALEREGPLGGETQRSEGSASGSEARIMQKVGEVVAQVELLERLDHDVSDREVDSLLRQAQNQLLQEKIFQGNGSVDALALLAEVEVELDRNFRDRLFEALKAGYSKLRTAVADRNP